MSTVHTHRRPHPHPAPPAPPAPAHPHLPSDATIEHDPKVIEIIQSYQDQIPEGVVGHGTVVMAYAVGPNPSNAGDFIGGAKPWPKHICYFWTEVSVDAALTQCSFDYIVERINEGKTTWND
jgi:hypothetical protein